MNGISRRAGVLATAFVLAFSFGWAWVGDGSQDAEPCQAEALKAYWQALRLCQLAHEDNPRLRCYEEAKAVYTETLCRCEQEHAGRR